LRVKEIMDQKHPSIYEDEPATKARALLRDLNLRIIPITDVNKKLLGKISRRDMMTITSSVSAMKVKSERRSFACQGDHGSEASVNL